MLNVEGHTYAVNSNLEVGMVVGELLTRVMAVVGELFFGGGNVDNTLSFARQYHLRVWCVNVVSTNVYVRTVRFNLTMQYIRVTHFTSFVMHLPENVTKRLMSQLF